MGPWGFWSLVIELLLWRLVCYVPQNKVIKDWGYDQTQAHTLLHLQDHNFAVHTLFLFNKISVFQSASAHLYVFCSSQELVGQYDCILQ